MLSRTRKPLFDKGKVPKAIYGIVHAMEDATEKWNFFI